MPTKSRAGTTTITETFHVHDNLSKAVLEPVFQSHGIKLSSDKEISNTFLEKGLESERSKQTFSFLELLSITKDKVLVVTLLNDYSAKQTIAADAHKGSKLSIKWEDSYNVNKEAEPFIPLSSFISTTKDLSLVQTATDVICDSTFIL